MILTIDIGNTNIMLGGFSSDELVFVSRMATDQNATEDEYAIRILSALSLHGIAKERVTGCIIASVVPPLNYTVKNAIRFVFGLEALVVGPGIKSGIGIRCDMPSSVGADLIAAAVAAPVPEPSRTLKACVFQPPYALNVAVLPMLAA